MKLKRFQIIIKVTDFYFTYWFSFLLVNLFSIYLFYFSHPYFSFRKLKWLQAKICIYYLLHDFFLLIYICICCFFFPYHFVVAPFNSPPFSPTPFQRFVCINCSYSFFLWRNVAFRFLLRLFFYQKRHDIDHFHKWRCILLFLCIYVS